MADKKKYEMGPSVTLRECTPGELRLDLRACNACCERVGDKRPHTVVGLNGQGVDKGWMSLCAGTIIKGIKIGVAECFSDPVKWSICTYDHQTETEGVLIKEGTSDLTVAGVIDVPVGADGMGFMVGKDDLTLVIKVAKVELSDDTMGCAAVCIEFCG